MYTDGQIYMGLADGQRVNMQLNMSLMSYKRFM